MTRGPHTAPHTARGRWGRVPREAPRKPRNEATFLNWKTRIKPGTVPHSLCLGGTLGGDAWATFVPSQETPPNTTSGHTAHLIHGVGHFSRRRAEGEKLVKHATQTSGGVRFHCRVYVFSLKHTCTRVHAHKHTCRHTQVQTQAHMCTWTHAHACTRKHTCTPRRSRSPVV